MAGTMKTRSAVPVVALLVVAAACGRPSEPPAATLDDALTAEDFDATVQQLTALPWLPWGYTPDGCYARALYYSMLLATKGIPSNHLYVVARPGTSLGGIWSWHVAPLVTKDGDPDRVFVLDPVYDQTKALTNLEWVAYQNFTDPTAATYPRLHVHAGTSYLDQFDVQDPVVNPAAPDPAAHREPTFAEMPSFAMTDVRAACSIMHQYIDIEPNRTPEQKAEKHLALGRETVSLVAALGTRGKLAGDPALPARCTRQADGGALTEEDEERLLPGLPESDPTRAPL